MKRILGLILAIVLTASQPFTSILVMSNAEMFKHEWIWIKNRGSNFANTVADHGSSFVRVTVDVQLNNSTVSSSSWIRALR